jgi:hypothetical protein
LASHSKKLSIPTILNSIFNKKNNETLKQNNGKKKSSKNYQSQKTYFESKKSSDLYKSRKERLQKVCKKYKMKVDEPSAEIFNSILCFSKYEVSDKVF